MTARGVLPTPYHPCCSGGEWGRVEEGVPYSVPGPAGVPRPVSGLVGGGGSPSSRSGGSPSPTSGGVSRKLQYKDVYRRTIEFRVHYEPLNSN